jgi:shikimate kinase
MKIFLIGFMGAGKTTIGKELSRKMHIPFFDLDHILEQEEKLKISEIFESLGEEKFRILEGKYLKTYPFPEQFILSTGGGTPCYYDHMDWMNNRGTTLYLQLSPKSLASRLELGKDQERPLLKEKKGLDLIQYIEMKLKEREPFYLMAKKLVKGEDSKVEDLIPILISLEKS